MPKINISITLDSGLVIALAVPCKYRATLYYTLLSDTVSNLYGQYQTHHFLKNVLMKPALWEHLAELLDKYVILYANFDLADYRKALHDTINTKELNPNLLTEYYQSRSQNKTYAEYLVNVFPELIGILELLAVNFKNSLTKTLMRIEADKRELIDIFFHECSSEECVLEEITQTDSDLHKNGQQVMILRFSKRFVNNSNNNNEEDKNIHREESVKIVYKPSSVLMDMLFVGNINQLKHTVAVKTIPSLDSAQSVAEIVNMCLSNVDDINNNNNQAPTIPTYIIYPKENENTLDSYGYIEYLSHRPWLESDLKEKVISTILEQLSTSTSKNSIQISQDVVKQSIRKALDEAKKTCLNTDNKHPCDYVVRSLKQVSRFSRQCGMLAGMATAFGITDMHLENLIVSNLQPYLIDLEISLNQVQLSLEATGFLEGNSGSMLSHLEHHTNFTHLSSIDGMDIVGASIPQKNRLYRLNEQERLELCKINKVDFDQGFEEVINFIANNGKEFLRWLDHPLLNQASVRIIPYETQRFYKDMTMLQSMKFKKTDFDDLKNSWIKYEIQQLDNLSNITEHRFAIFLSDNVYNNLIAGNVPVYYMKTSGKSLINSDGQVVIIDYDKVGKCSSIERIQLPKNTNDYLQETPLNYIYQQVTRLIFDNQFRQQVLVEAKKLSAKALNNEPKTIHSKKVTPITQEEANEKTRLLPDNHDKPNDDEDSTCIRCVIN